MAYCEGSSWPGADQSLGEMTVDGGLEVPVPGDEESSWALGSRQLAAVVETPAASSTTSGHPMVNAAGVPTITAASMIDLKGIARPQLFDGKDEHWADWKYNFRNVMSLLDITPYLG